MGDESVSLTEVDVASNELDDDVGVALARVLARNAVLRKLDLVHNRFGLRTGEALLDTLRRRNSTLITIGDTENALFELGISSRYQIQRHLDANRHGLSGEPSDDPMDPALAEAEWKILE